jgi:hypothetical protein
VFYLLGAPLVLSSADPVFGGRIYAQILQLLVALTLYSVTRRIAGKLAATVAVITLLGSPSFVDPSRHYLLETLLTLEVLLLLYLIDRYYEASRLSYLILMGFVISAGLLTKFNFFFYAVWLFIVPAMVECYRVIRAGQPISNAMLFVVIVMVGPLVIAGPWYISRATGTTSPLGLLAQQFDAGSSTKGWDIVLFPIAWNYSRLIVSLAGFTTMMYLGFVSGLPFLRSAIRPMTRAQHVVLSSAMIGAVGSLPVLAFSGMGGELRWHIEAVYMFVFIFAVLDQLNWRKLRLIVLALTGIAGVLQLSTLYVSPVIVPSFLRVPDLMALPRPSAIPIGSEILANDIARHEIAVGGTKPGDFVSFLYHEHGGPHFGSVEFYLHLEGVTLPSRVGAFWNRPVNLENIFDAKYLVEETARYTTPIWRDFEEERYQGLAEHFPPAFRSLLVEVSDVRGRLGRFKAYYVPREKLTREIVLDTIAIGRQLETVDSFLVFWDAQRVLWRAKFEAVEGNTTLRDEIDAVVARSGESQSRLTPMNLQTLRDYLAKLAAIRAKASRTSASPGSEARKS